MSNRPRVALTVALVALSGLAAGRLGAAQHALDELLQDRAHQLFVAYQQQSLARFGEVLGSARQFYQSVNQDFANLRGIQFSDYVHPPVYDPRHTTARVSVTWFRRASFAVTGEEWIVRAQTSILVFDVTGDPPLLLRIEGAPLFGLSGVTGTLEVDRGEINGVPVTRRRIVRNGRLDPAVPRPRRR